LAVQHNPYCFLVYHKPHLKTTSFPASPAASRIFQNAECKKGFSGFRKSPFDLFVCVLCVFIVSIFDLNYSVHWTALFRFIPDVTAFVWLSG
ncbi:MAG: hypothetical protein PUJ35_05590, partial [Ruminococcus bromii]|nr:hypothetical protein [Ruminococcus bromii]